MNDTMDFNPSPTNDIEHQVRFDDKDTIACISELVIPRYVSKKWVSLKPADTSIEFIDEGCSTNFTVVGYPVED